VGEAKTAVGLSHPNIVPVYELGVEQGVYYIAMEYCPGVTLADVLFETGPLEADEGAYVGAEVCRALDYAHRRASIVHRDVTPRNVLIDDEGAIRLIDFGIAAPVEASSGRAREVFGSPGHMPPEQLRGEELGPPADLFAVGVLLVEAWTGLPPFRRATPQASAEALRKAPPRIDTENAALAPLADIVGACLALDIKRRPARAEDLGKKLREFLRNADTVAVARLLAERIQRMKKEQRRSVSDGRPSSAPPEKRRSEPPGETPKTPPLGIPASVPPVTRTFAAREELVVWTRRLSSAPPSPDDAKRVSAPASDGPRTTRERSLARPARVAAIGAALLLAGATGLALSRQPRAPERASVDAGAPPPTPRLPPAAEPARVNPEEPRVPAAIGSETPGAPVLPAVPAASQRRPAAPVPPPATIPTPPSSASPVAVASATLRLTADPPAVVSVKGDGFEQTSSTPVLGMALRPGVYTVTFRNETSRAPVATRVVLQTGGEHRVHADFRAAEPSITQR
jgi:serine/threonine-protein kinase